MFNVKLTQNKSNYLIFSLRRGSSRQAIVKFIVANNQLDEKLVNTHRYQVGIEEW